MDRIDALLTKLQMDANKLRTHDELNAVVEDIFGQLDDLKNRTKILKTNLTITKLTLE